MGGAQGRATASPLLVVVAAIFVTALVTANIISVKLFQVAGQVLPAGIIIFPLSYIIGDVLTEVYGFRAARRVIWLGFLCNLIAVLAIWGGGMLPAAPDWDGQAAYERTLGFAPRLLVASFGAYLVGETSNAAVLSRLKVLTGGRWLWSRTIGSTVVGQGLDSIVFITVAFLGVVPDGVLLSMVAVQWLAKTAYEAAATPLTYGVVAFLKRREGVDTYDREMSWNPIAL